MKDGLSVELLYYITAGAILVATIIVATILNRFMKRYVKTSTTALDNNATNYHFLRRGIVGLIYLVGLSLAVYSVPGLKALAQSLLAGAGIAAVAIGFASQAALSNLIAGIFIVIFKPFRVNDRIVIKDTISGVVEDITLRHTIIRNFENRRVIIPNSIISNEVIVNADLVDAKICQWIDIGISYDSDVAKAKQIIAEVVGAHPLFLDTRTEEDITNDKPLVMVRVIGMGESSVNLRGWSWAKDQADAFVLRCDVFESIKQRFDQEGIEIPFPHRTLVYKNAPPK